jgi:hypothetical protein
MFPVRLICSHFCSQSVPGLSSFLSSMFPVFPVFRYVYVVITNLNLYGVLGTLLGTGNTGNKPEDSL